MSKRADDFQEQAEKYADDVWKEDADIEQKCITMTDYFAGAEYGYQYAQEHPAWVSVEDELPPLHYEGANSTDFVLIYDGDDVLIAYYDFKEKKWYNEQYGALIIPATHWMPIPQPPVKKGGKQ